MGFDLTKNEERAMSERTLESHLVGGDHLTAAEKDTKTGAMWLYGIPWQNCDQGWMLST